MYLSYKKIDQIEQTSLRVQEGASISKEIKPV